MSALGQLVLYDDACRKLAAAARIAEVFLQSHKPACQSDANARDSAIAASLALQFGCPLDVLRRALLRDARQRIDAPHRRDGVIGAASRWKPAATAPHQQFLNFCPAYRDGRLPSFQLRRRRSIGGQP